MMWCMRTADAEKWQTRHRSQLTGAAAEPAASDRPCNTSGGEEDDTNCQGDMEKQKTKKKYLLYYVKESV